MKKITPIVLILMLLLSTLLCGCGNSDKTISQDGTKMNLTAEKIKEEGRNGFYVLNADGTFTPVMNAAEGYAGDTTETERIHERYLWFTNNKVNMSDLIPTVSQSTPLVAIFDADDDMPSIYTLEKYIYKGYTIGCHIYRNEDDTLCLDTDNTLSDSSAGEGMEEYDSQEFYLISTINGSDQLPVKNVDNNMRILLGLEKGKYYEFDFYKGTRYEKLTTIADTQILQAEDITILQNPYTKTHKGYFTINLPDNLQPGYYYICGAGLFRYAG